MIKSSVFRALTSNASSLQASKCKGVKALSPRTTRRQLYLTPSVKSKAEKNTVDISGQDSFFQSKFLYYEAQIKSLQEKNAHSSPEKLELCLEYLEALLQFTPNKHRGDSDVVNMCFQEIKRACLSTKYSNDSSYTKWKTAPIFMVLKEVERENNDLKQSLDNISLRLSTSINTSKKIAAESKDSKKKEKSMRLKLAISKRNILTEQKRCKELEREIVILKKQIEDLSSSLKDTRNIIVRNGIMPISEIRKNVRSSDLANLNSKAVTRLCFSNAFKDSLAKAAMSLEEYQNFEKVEQNKLKETEC